jgi:Holliday junction resolvase RusA-like endonuclease
MGNIKIYNITPMSKPRMTKRDRWAKRPVVLKYFAYRDLVKEIGVALPECNYHVIFVLPIPASWSKKKKAEHKGQPHRQRPDKDNLEKGLLDAVFEEDSVVWDGRVSKIWGETGAIIVLTGDMVEPVKALLISKDINKRCFDGKRTTKRE